MHAVLRTGVVVFGSPDGKPVSTLNGRRFEEKEDAEAHCQTLEGYDREIGNSTRFEYSVVTV